MVLTEPDAGSDVGAGRTKAVQQDDGSWHITGVKRVITSAEHDLSDNIVHLGLAPPRGGGGGRRLCSRTTARGTSPASSGSSPRPSTTSRTTSSTWSWLAPRGRGRAP